jgi:hypothetical protein
MESGRESYGDPRATGPGEAGQPAARRDSEGMLNRNPRVERRRLLLVALPALLFDARTVVLVFEDATLDAGGARRVAATLLLAGVPRGGDGLTLPFLEGREQAFAGKLAIRGLRPGILDGDGQAGRAMAQRDAGRDLVDVLSARTGGAGEMLLEVGFVEMRGGRAHSPPS